MRKNGRRSNRVDGERILAPKDGTLRGAVVASLCLANDSGAVAKPVGRHRCRAVKKNVGQSVGFLGVFFVNCRGIILKLFCG